MELRDYLQIIRKHKWIVILVTLAVMAGYSVFFFTQEPTYTAQSRLMLRVPPEWQDMTVITMPGWQTRVQLITSKPVTNRASERLQQNGVDISPGAISGGLSTKSQENTDFVDIAFKASSSTRAIQVTRVVTEEFIEYDRENNLGSLNSAQRTLESQFERVRSELRETEQKLSRFKKNKQIVSPDAQLTGSFQQLYSLNDRKLEITSKLENTNNKLRRYQTMLSKQENAPGTNILSVEKSLIEATTQELSKARVKLNGLKQRYGPKHPKIIETKDRIKALEQELRGSVEDHLENLPLIQNRNLRKQVLDLTFNKQNLQSKSRMVEQRQNNIQEQISQISSGQSQLAEYQRRLDFAEKRFSQLQEKIDQVRFNKSLLDESGKIVSLPDNTSIRYPTTYRTYGFVLLAGLLFGITTGGFLEYINNKIETRFDIHRYLDLPVLGSIPEVEEDIELIDLPRKTPLTEQYHSISIRLQYSLLKEHDLRSILMASSIRGEGKSITLMNLGVTLAREGEKVLMIDLDLRDPVLHKKFELMNSEGASTILSGQAHADQELESMEQPEPDSKFDWSAVNHIIEETGESGLDVLPSGPVPANPVQLVKSDYFERLIALATREYGVVLLDSPPLYSVVDSVVMANKVDGVVMVTRSGVVTKGQAQHSKHLLEDTGASLMGVVLNGVEHEGESYYTYYRQSSELDSMESV